jgi:hypothetical protein
LALQTDGFRCLDVASLDADLQRIVAIWEGLPTHIRTAILALVALPDLSETGKP